MRKLAFSFTALVPLAATVAMVGCSGAGQPSTSGAGAGQGGGAGTSQAKSPVDEVARAHQFVDARYRAEDVRKSFRTSAAQDIDCIDFFAQPGVRRLAAQGHPITSLPKLPDMPASFRASQPSASAEPIGAGVEFDGTLDESGNARSCPEGTVPQVRVTVEQVMRAGGVDAFRKAVHQKGVAPKAFKSSPDEYGSCEGDIPGYAHVYGQLLTPYPQPIAAGSSTMAIYGPTIPTAANDDDPVIGDHSIAQTWMVGTTAADAPCPNCEETVEVGWDVDQGLYTGDTHVPHLFIFSTNDSYQTVGCYNDLDPGGSFGYYDDAGNIDASSCLPWVQVSRQDTPGMALPASAIKAVNPRNPSTLPKELSLSTINIGGNWWILMQVSGGLPTLLGYYAGSSLQGTMNVYELGGEVYDGTGVFAGAGVEMGSGQVPSEGQGYAAYHRDYFALVTGGTDGGSPLIDNAFVCAARAGFYNYATPKPVSQADGPWVNSFFYGGNPSASATDPGSE